MPHGRGTRLTVTVDDGGSCDGVNGAVRTCAGMGRLHRVSVLATGPSWREACEIAAGAGVEISVHLNCIEPPFLGPSEFPVKWSAWVLSAGRLADSVRREWTLQVERVLSAGFRVSRLDSHRHLHHLGALRRVVLDLALEYGAGSVRSARLPDKAARPSGIVLDVLAARLSGMAAARGIGTTSSILGFSSSGRIDRAYLERYGGRLPGGECEVVMHPALENVWSDGQVGEFELMTSEWFGEWILAGA